MKKWHFVNSQSEFIAAHFTSSGKTLTVESATTMGKGKFNKCWLEHRVQLVKSRTKTYENVKTIIP